MLGEPAKDHTCITCMETILCMCAVGCMQKSTMVHIKLTDHVSHTMSGFEKSLKGNINMSRDISMSW